MSEMEKQDKYLKQLIQESNSFILGDDFTDSLMQKIQLEKVLPMPQEKPHELLWHALAIVISFIALVAYLLNNPKVIVQIIQTAELILSQVSISPSVLSIIFGVILIFGLDNLFKRRFPRIHYMF
jgi:hypothetical protein